NPSGARNATTVSFVMWHILFSARTVARQQRLDMPPNHPITNFRLLLGARVQGGAGRKLHRLSPHRTGTHARRQSGRALQQLVGGFARPGTAYRSRLINVAGQGMMR
ncbi:MAG: hypothetical protein JJU19_09350, partial [Pararhodobacter sp.]|nr:hypothetical protein [Pararhodobacter sp.]